MSLLRILAVLALMFWVGGLLALGGFAAPTVFAVLEGRDPIGGRELAGFLFGEILRRFQIASWVAGAAVLASLGLRAALGPRPRWFALRLWTAAAMLVASVATVRVITPRIDGIRTSVHGPVAALPDDDQRRIAFGRWHALSTGLMLLTIVGGIGLIHAEVRDPH